MPEEKLRLKGMYAAWLLLFLTFIVGARVFFLSASLPFFAGTDEPSHYDTVWKYAHGYMPKRLEKNSLPPSREVVLYRSYELLNSPPSRYARYYYVPRWKGGLVTHTTTFQADVQNLANGENMEVVQPPVYYWVAGGWYRIGAALGLRGGWLLYWIRFLNVALFAALIPLAYGLGRACYPERKTVAIMAAIVVSAVPQDIFFSITNDVLVPVVSAAALLILVRWLQLSRPSLFTALGIGLLIGIAALVKLLNFALWLPVVVFLVLKGKTVPLQLRAALAVAMLIPAVLWMAWNYSNGVGFTNSAEKIAYLGWTPKALAQIWPHPIFTPGGALEFWRATMANYWGGEGVFHGQRLTPRWMEWIYASGTVVFLLAAFWRRERSPADLAFGLYFAAGVLSLVLLSLRWDFGTCLYPSREKPYFVSGRLILGSFVPVILLCCLGIDRMLLRFPKWGRLVATVIVCVGLVLLQVKAVTPAFRSPFNWYHLDVPPDPSVLRGN